VIDRVGTRGEGGSFGKKRFLYSHGFVVYDETGTSCAEGVGLGASFHPWHKLIQVLGRRRRAD